ncbi:DUF3575 domain-containing protein [Pararhodonellum marinum]|uniref:DUF3575 domain-containing protein n=1 Tax=Pararhodonellum marinum TaxID=2755358 RepID=UPI00189039B9|nr:DUF3575 domain-containing protein [Pararhodonellum marinum]
MKKLVFILLLAIGNFGVQAQQVEVLSPKNEVKLNMLNTILIGTVELGYEYLIDDNQSIDVQVHFNDRFGYFAGGSNRDFSARSIQAAYNFYLSQEEKNAGFYFSPLLRYRFGEYTETRDGALSVTNLNSFLLGMGVGYKILFENKFTIAPFANIGRNFGEETIDRFSALELKAGVSFGFRF